MPAPSSGAPHVGPAVRRDAGRCLISQNVPSGAPHPVRASGRSMQRKLLPTTLVGSYPQPEWLIDRPMLTANTPPRVRMRELWRVAPEFLEQAQDDATVIAIR